MESHDGISQAAQWLWTLGIALVTGVVKYLQRFTADPRPRFDWIVFSIQVLTAVCAGVITHWLSVAWKVDQNLANAAVALAGWGGAEFIAFLERKVRGTTQES